MIARINRFHGHGSLNPIYRKGQGVSMSLVSLKHLPAKTDKRGRLAVVVSRKVDKSAVTRNRIRRRVYALTEPELSNIKPKSDLVISVHNSQLASMEASELKSLIKQLLQKAGLLKA